jgi:hypothetical protein
LCRRQQHRYRVDWRSASNIVWQLSVNQNYGQFRDDYYTSDYSHYQYTKGEWGWWSREGRGCVGEDTAIGWGCGTPTLMTEKSTDEGINVMNIKE